MLAAVLIASIVAFGFHVKADGDMDDFTCRCSGDNKFKQTGMLQAELSEEWGEHYGEQCFAWEFDDCHKWKDYAEFGPWCCQRWCYVDKRCHFAKPSGFSWAADAELYFSYRACDDNQQEVDSCPWTQPDAKTDNVAKIDKTSSCSCTGDNLYPSVRVKFGEHYGTQCLAWEFDDCHKGGQNKHEPGSWCCRSWCYVDQSCPTAQPSLLANGLFFSYDACSDNQLDVNTCPWVTSCSCTGDNTFDGAHSEKELELKWGEHYGERCHAWELDNCGEIADEWERPKVIFPESDVGSWCCKRWCYVDASCPSALPSSIVDGLFYSYEVCPDKNMEVEACPWYGKIAAPAEERISIENKTQKSGSTVFGVEVIIVVAVAAGLSILIAVAVGVYWKNNQKFRHLQEQPAPQSLGQGAL